MRRTSRSQWATCSRKCSAAGASASSGRPRCSRVCCARHPVLALPGISGMWRPRATESWHCQVFLAFATQFWHCQGFLARAAHVPLNAGTAKDSWRSARPRPAHRVECLCTHLRRDGRAVECNGLENRRGFTPSVSSNLTPSAIITILFLNVHVMMSYLYLSYVFVFSILASYKFI